MLYPTPNNFWYLFSGLFCSIKSTSVVFFFPFSPAKDEESTVSEYSQMHIYILHHCLIPSGLGEYQKGFLKLYYFSCLTLLGSYLELLRQYHYMYQKQEI